MEAFSDLTNSERVSVRKGLRSAVATEMAESRVDVGRGEWPKNWMGLAVGEKSIAQMKNGSAIVPPSTTTTNSQGVVNTDFSLNGK